MTSFLNDPFVEECIRELRFTNLLTPLGAIGEKRIYVEHLKHGMVDFFNFSGETYVPSEAPFPIKELAEDILLAPIVFIESEMISVLSSMQWKVKEAYDKYGHMSAKEWPFDMMWQTSPSGFKMNHVGFEEEKSDVEEAMEVDAFFIFNFEKIKQTDHFHSILIGFKTDTKTGRVLAFVSPLHDFSADALAIFLEEKICRISKVRPPNWLRKKAEKKGFQNSDVHIITLRPFETVGRKEKNQDGQTFDRQYFHQWFVRGHLRNHFFPSRGTHELIWIDPYRKGPEDKPFIEQVRHVIR